MLAFGGGKAYLNALLGGGKVSQSSSLPATLFPFQKDGVEWLKDRKGAILADEQGLGKTRQAVVADEESPRTLTIVVAPKVTFKGWRDTISSFSKRPQAVCPSARPKGTVGKLSFPKEGWFILNPEQLGKYSMPEVDFTLIVDEGHWYTNHKAQRTKALLALSETTTKVWILTGTLPAQPIKLWPLFLLTKERQAHEFFPFALRYCGAEKTDFGWNFSGATHLDELRDELRHFVLRRTKQDVLPELPEKTYTTIVSAPSGKTLSSLSILDRELLTQAKMGRPLSAGLGLEVAQKYRMECSMQKVDTTVEYIEAFGDAKLVVFFEFLDPLHKVSAHFPHALKLIGDTTNEKDEIIHRFSTDPERNLLFCTYGAGGVGANLQVASTVVVHDLPYSPDTLAQAEDRVHRIGQRGGVNIVTVITPTLCEAIMLRGLQDKVDMNKALYEADATLTTEGDSVILGPSLQNIQGIYGL